MARIFSIIVALAWALWLGGLITLFAVVGTIFTTPGFGRDVQGAFAARLFPIFERMQLVFAAVSLLATVAWWISSRARLKLVLFGFFAIATVIAAFETTRITPRIEEMRVDGRRGTPEFERLHHLSTQVYGSGAVILLIAGFFLPSAIRGDSINPATPRTSAETAPA